MLTGTVPRMYDDKPIASLLLLMGQSIDNEFERLDEISREHDVSVSSARFS